MKTGTNQEYLKKTYIYRTVKKLKPLLLKGNAIGQAECSMSGALALAFRLSQIVGIAPVRFDGGRVRMSRALIVLSCIVGTVWLASGFRALVMDLSEPSDRSVRAFSTTRRCVWLCDFSIVMTISCLAVFRGPRRTRAVLSCLGHVQKINHNLDVPRPTIWKEIKKYVAIILYTTCIVSTIVGDFVFILAIANYFDPTGEQTRITYFYTGYYYAYTTLFFTVMQFIICAHEIYRTMRSLNILLEEVAQAASLKKTKILNPFVGINVVQIKALNKITDSLLVNDSVYPGITKSSKTAHETIRHLSLMYSSACEAVRQLNDCFAPELLALLMSFLLHLVVTPYNCIANISGGKINMQLLTMQLLWCSIHFVSLIVMVEPCHITQREMGRTNFLVSQLMLQNTDELVTNELNVFGRYLYLNDVVYSPMGICVLSRSLVASILASVTTYLVIMMQFQATENIVYHG